MAGDSKRLDEVLLGSLAKALGCWSGPMSVDVTSSILIERSRAIVSEYAANPDRCAGLVCEHQGCRVENAAARHDRVADLFVAEFLGRRMAYTYEVVELVPGERLVMRTAEGPFPMETTYTWETTPDGATRMTLRNRGTPTGFSRWLAPFMARAMHRANRKDLAALKQRLESPVPG